jgi:hypothetical protein
MSEDSMENPAAHHRRAATTARVCLVTALGLAAAGALTLALWPSTPAVAQTTSTEEPVAGIFAVAGQISPGTYGIYLVDEQHGTMAVYEYVPAERKLHLRAARAYAYDLQLESYNTEPAPAEIAKMVGQARRIAETAPAAP